MDEDMERKKNEEEQFKSIQEEIKEKEKAELQMGSDQTIGENDKMEMDEKEMKKNIQDKKMKNIISLAILLFGLFLGSVFVDLNQLVRGSGYSQKNLNKAEIFESEGKTWVAYDAPAVPMSVISDDNCEECDPSEVLVWLRRVMPTISVEKVNFDSQGGQKLIDKFGIKTLPAFIFDTSVEETELYAQANDLFTASNGQDIMNAQLLGIPVGKYLSSPTISSEDPTLGNVDSKVKVVIFSDFQCPYCKTFFPVFQSTIEKYKDQVEFSFKDFPLKIHPQANDASLAAACAQDQGKFWEYADKLYSSQAEWGNDNATTFFKKYAVKLGLDTAKFNQCLDERTGQGRIDALKIEADSFAISGTPIIFINDQVESGVISADQLEKDIETQLNK